MTSPERNIDFGKQAETRHATLSRDEILRACEIREGERVPLEQIERIFNRFPELVAGGGRNYYWELRRALESDYENIRLRRPAGPRGFADLGDGIVVSRFQENSVRASQPPWIERTGTYERDDIFGDEAQTSVGAQLSFVLCDRPLEERPLLTLVYSTSNDRAQTYWNEGPFATFTSTEDFRPLGIFIQKPGKPKVRIAECAKNSDVIVDYSRVAEIVDSLIPFPDEDVSDALRTLDALMEQERVPDRERKNLRKAIQDFASFVKPPPNEPGHRINEIGKCRTVPSDFQAYCTKRLGLQMELEEYGDGVTFYHQVNRFGNILIDWTARQYGEYADSPYPRVYRLDELLPNEMKPRSQWTEAERKMAAEITEWNRHEREY
ncbi:hypothetical protein A2348_00025 [Candidatus Uhrbacteria bacterium RIFOXYB12_FULL_58_10]|uniref:Uncharacterized protein n=1 Tax=Candidatus Uhrbacteria bacterium RIFOXYB2_FULL_57_15 TaxID=1802422 RepID=A0A1F7W7Q7_9BACT|nr:MAG: hypothetical protein A2348_00025 [Candidatus Uhrbacteria bacterium RIFOXYB12_FULL_58_10]OGL98124.1 MAG: hypothetical protein A2304_03530 [Candidatus Uhrbacteria bacterium RIFOXYB2_FULL_57_15]OGM00108.1 MAG: hypothetical protein A2501_01185 [Candidatus Uhrbacteria bacterium RIFOXYC12_FULL_57_11]